MYIYIHKHTYVRTKYLQEEANRDMEGGQKDGSRLEGVLIGGGFGLGLGLLLTPFCFPLFLCCAIFTGVGVGMRTRVICTYAFFLLFFGIKMEACTCMNMQTCQSNSTDVITLCKAYTHTQIHTYSRMLSDFISCVYTYIYICIYIYI